MADETRWKGGKLGPYYVGRRLRGLGSAPGRLYEARHAETGAPALVMMPGRKEDWAPRECWQVRVTAHDVPPFLALEVEQAPRRGPLAVQELTLLLHRLARIVSRVEERQQVREHLTGPAVKEHRGTRGRGTRWMRRGLAVAATVGLAMGLAVALWPLSADRETETGVTPSVATTTLKQEEDFFLTRDTALEPEAIARPMPDKPIRGQKKPPCNTPTEVEIRGGCWIATEHRPPCPRGTAEYEGKCYVGVGSEKQEPVSIEPSAPNPPPP